MAQRSKSDYWYEATIIRNGQAVLRQGTVRAYQPLQALDQIYEMAETQWNKSIIKCKIHEIDEHGELIVQSETGEQKLLPEKEDKKPHTCEGSLTYTWATEWRSDIFGTMKMENLDG